MDGANWNSICNLVGIILVFLLNIHQSIMLRHIKMDCYRHGKPCCDFEISSEPVVNEQVQ